MRAGKRRLSILLLAFLVVFSLQAIPALAEYDYTQFEEVDPDGVFTVTSENITFTQLDLGDDTAYVGDPNIGQYFGTGSTVEYSFTLTDHITGANAFVILGAMTNNVVGDQDDWGPLGDWLEIKAFYKYLLGSYTVKWRANFTTPGYTSSTEQSIQGNTKYYVKYYRLNSTAVIVTVDNNEDYSSPLLNDTVTVDSDWSPVGFYAIAQDASNPPDDSLYISGIFDDLNINTHGISEVTSLTITEMNEVAYKITYNSNTTGNHLLTWDTDPNMASPDGSRWSNNTNSPEFWLWGWEIKTWNAPLYLKMYVPGVGYLNNTDTTPLQVTIPDIQHGPIQAGIKAVNETYCDQGNEEGIAKHAVKSPTYDPSTGLLYASYFDDDTNVYTFLYSDDAGLTWRTASTLDVDPDIPSGWDAFRNVRSMATNGTHVLISIGVKETSGSNRGSVGYITDDYVSGNWTYLGFLMQTGETVPDGGATANARVIDLLWNPETGHWEALWGGSSSTGGSWHYVYHSVDTDDDLSFIGEEETLIYAYSDFSSGAWADTFVYPPKTLSYNYGTASCEMMGTITGCGSSVAPYDFDTDLFFEHATDASAIETSDFYTDTDDAPAYFNYMFGTGGPRDLGMDLVSGSEIWSVNQTVFILFYEYKGTGVTDPDAGEGWISTMEGFWANEIIGVRPGRSGTPMYYSLPTETEFKNMLPIKVYTQTEAVNVTVIHLNGAAPEYGKLKVYAPASGSTNVTVKVNDLVNKTIYVDITEDSDANGDYYLVQLLSSGGDFSTSPGGDGDDFIFSFTASGSSNTAPSAPTLSSPVAHMRRDPEETVKFSWSFSDPDRDNQGAYRFQLDDDLDFSSPIIDTGKVSSSTSSTTQTMPSTVGKYYWRVMVWDDGDEASGWSTPRAIYVDQVLITSLGSDLSSTIVNHPILLYCTAELEYDGHPLGAGDILRIEDTVFNWDEEDSRFEATVTSETVETVTYDTLTSCEENTYGITSGSMNGYSLTVSWTEDWSAIDAGGGGGGGDTTTGDTGDNINEAIEDIGEAIEENVIDPIGEIAEDIIEGVNETIGGGGGGFTPPSPEIHVPIITVPPQLQTWWAQYGALIIIAVMGLVFLIYFLPSEDEKARKNKSKTLGGLGGGDLEKEINKALKKLRRNPWS